MFNNRFPFWCTLHTHNDCPFFEWCCDFMKSINQYTGEQHQQYRVNNCFWRQIRLLYFMRRDCVHLIKLFVAENWPKLPTNAFWFTFIPMWWLNGPINAFWIAENPFTVILIHIIQLLLWKVKRKKVLIDWMCYKCELFAQKTKICTKKDWNSNDLFYVEHFVSLFGLFGFASNKTKRNSSNWISTVNSIMFQCYLYFSSFVLSLLNACFSWEKTSLRFDIDGNTTDPFISIHLMQFVVKSASFVFTKMQSFIFVISSFCLMKSNKKKAGEKFFRCF